MKPIVVDCSSVFSGELIADFTVIDIHLLNDKDKVSITNSLKTKVYIGWNSASIDNLVMAQHKIIIRHEVNTTNDVWIITCDGEESLVPETSPKVPAIRRTVTEMIKSLCKENKLTIEQRIKQLKKEVKINKRIIAELENLVS